MTRARKVYTEYTEISSSGIVKSILEMRNIYKEKNDKEFSLWYSKKYKVDKNDVLRIVEKYSMKEVG